MKLQATLALISFCTLVMIAGAQSSTKDQPQTQETQARGVWFDPSTGLMWAGKDNGKDVSWKKAMKYCRDLRLDAHSGYSPETRDLPSNAPHARHRLARARDDEGRAADLAVRQHQDHS